jgi:hypothetical protein
VVVAVPMVEAITPRLAEAEVAGLWLGRVTQPTHCHLL